MKVAAKQHDYPLREGKALSDLSTSSLKNFLSCSCVFSKFIQGNIYQKAKQTFPSRSSLPQPNISQSIAAWVENIGSGWTVCILTLWLGTLLAEKLWWGWSFFKKHKSRSALALDWEGSGHCTPRPAGSLGALWEQGVGLGDRGDVTGGGWGTVCHGHGAGEAAGHGCSPRSQHRSGADTGCSMAVCPAGTPLLVCFPCHGAGNTARIHLSFASVSFISAFQIVLEQELLLSTC